MKTSIQNLNVFMDAFKKFFKVSYEKKVKVKNIDPYKISSGDNKRDLV